MHFALLDEALGEQVIERMARLVGDEAAVDRAADEIEIAVHGPVPFDRRGHVCSHNNQL